jgi:hypothetical protein
MSGVGDPPMLANIVRIDMAGIARLRGDSN